MPVRHRPLHRTAALQERHRARVDFRGLDRDGRLLRREGDVAAAARRRWSAAFYEDIGVLQYPTRRGQRHVLTVIMLLLGRADPAHGRHPQGTDAVTERSPPAAGVDPLPIRRPTRVGTEPRRPSLDVLCTGDLVHRSMSSRSMDRCSASTSCRSRTSRGGLVFPMRGIRRCTGSPSLQHRCDTGDIKGAFSRSIRLAVVVTIITVVISFLSGLAFRKRFAGDGLVFYLMIGSLVAPGLRSRHRRRPDVATCWARDQLVHLRARRATILDAAVRRAGDVRGDVAASTTPGRRRRAISAPAPGRRSFS